MNLLYNTGIRAYKLLARFASCRSDKVDKMIEGQRHTFDRLSAARRDLVRDGFDVWIHAASLGEFEQARPVIEGIRRHRPDLSILLSFFSPSGYEVRHKYDKVDCVVYLPFDTPANAHRFVELARPKMTIFVKYEFWGNYLEALAAAGVPSYLISATFRSGQAFFKPWGKMMRNILDRFSRLYVQDEISRQLLTGIGCNDVVVAGDTRFDRVTDVMNATFDIPSLASWTSVDANSFTLIAGSSWPADEDIYISWLKEHPDVKAIIAPHEFDSRRLAELRTRLGNKTVLWSEVKDCPSLPDNVQYIIIDCFGLLSSLYRYGDVAIIGGGFGAGIHNINEAAVYGLPVIFGPNHHKFHEAKALIECGGGFCYHDNEELSSIFNRLLGDAEALGKSSQAAADYIKRNLGATNIILKDLFDINNR